MSELSGLIVDIGQSVLDRIKLIDEYICIYIRYRDRLRKRSYRTIVTRSRFQSFVILCI